MAIDQDAGKPGMLTRHAFRKVILPIRTEALIDGLVRLARSFSERPVLIATVRMPLVLISAHREILSRHYRMVLPDHQQVLTLENKEHLLAAAMSVGMPIPQTLVVNNETSLRETAEFNYPVILKPADNDLVYMSHFKKAYILEKHQDVADLARAIWPKYRNVVVQEWVPGDDEAIYFCLQYRNEAGQVVASFTGRKLLSWPPGTGATAACCAAPEYHDVLNALAEVLFAPLEVAGFCSIEVKRHPATGVFYLIEPTIGRTDQQEEVATLNGVNLPLIGYCDQMGQVIPTTGSTPANHTWVHPTSTRWARQWLKERDRPLPALKAPPGKIHDALFRWSDPVPALFDRWLRLSKAVHSVGAAATGNSKKPSTPPERNAAADICERRPRRGR